MDYFEMDSRPQVILHGEDGLTSEHLGVRPRTDPLPLACPLVVPPRNSLSLEITRGPF